MRGSGKPASARPVPARPRLRRYSILESARKESAPAGVGPAGAYAGRRGGRGDGSPPGIRDRKVAARHQFPGCCALSRGRARDRLLGVSTSWARRPFIGANPEQFRLPPRSRSDEGEPLQPREATVSKFTPIGPQASGVVEGSGVSRPKLGRHGRREIGRALEAMYEDVVKQGVPPRILQLLEGLDARPGGTRESPTA